MTVHDFDESLAYSHSQSDQPWWEEVYRRAFPDMVRMEDLRQDGWHQRAGRDRAIMLPTGRVIYVDEKSRKEDYGDILVELWSQYPKGGVPPFHAVPKAKPGWAVEVKDCDWFAYAIEPARTCYLLPYLGLRAAVVSKGHVWQRLASKPTEAERQGFRWCKVPNRVYDTINIAVPTDVLQKAITNAMTVTWGPPSPTAPAPVEPTPVFDETRQDTDPWADIEIRRPPDYEPGATT